MQISVLWPDRGISGPECDNGIDENLAATLAKMTIVCGGGRWHPSGQMWMEGISKSNTRLCLRNSVSV